MELPRNGGAAGGRRYNRRKMPARACLLGLIAMATAAAAQEAVPQLPLRNVEIVDKEGATCHLAGFYRLSGEDKFRGYLGSGNIEVPYAKVREIRVQAPEHPAGRPRAQLILRSGATVDATFDQREAEQLFTGYASFGRVTIFFRDLRELRFLGNTSREDLPVYGPAGSGLDVRLTDREGVTTELVGFRRTVNESALPAVRGAATISIPLRILVKVTILPSDDGSALLRGTATLRDGSEVEFRLPTYVENVSYSGDAEFGTYRIRLRMIRSIEVHGPTPALRDLDPLEAAKGREVAAEDDPGR